MRPNLAAERLSDVDDGGEYASATERNPSASRQSKRASGSCDDITFYTNVGEEATVILCGTKI